jgi:putative ABC transport system permease protein
VSPERYWFPSPRTGAQIPLATYRGREATPGEIGGVTEAYLEANNKSLERGRFFTEAEVRRGALVTVIGFKIAEALFPFEDPIGRTIQLKGRRFEVIGVLAEQGSSGFETVDDHLLLPLPTFDRLFPAVQREFGTLIAAVPRSPALLERAIDEGRNVLRQRRGLRFRDPDNFAVVTPDRLIGNLRAVTDGIAATMILIASISLLVGGVGIMNIMLVSVKERTREIGLRKALGAKQGDILSQFLIEASTLGLVGGALGVAFGVGIAVAVRQLSTLATATPLWSILIGLAVSLGVGLTFGIFPAYRAAKLDPIEALRYE